MEANPPFLALFDFVVRYLLVDRVLVQDGLLVIQIFLAVVVVVVVVDLI